ncbi:MAG TPA: glycosyltransferase family 4 protein [Casimicrobiaceae bacterium]
MTASVSGARRRLVVEGWRFLPHSYALVAQAHCLCIARRPEVDLRFADLPRYSEAWRPARGIFSPAEERTLAEIRAPEASLFPEATFTLRPERPDFSAPRSGRRFAFATAEYRVLTAENAGGLRSAAEVPDSVDVVTPSRWTALAFERFGFPPERVHVVPHGIDPALFRPDAASRQATREAIGAGDAFVFASVGAMTWNKGLDILLAAFARVAETEPDVRLLLKGADALYPSREFVGEVLGDLPARARETVVSKLIYEGRTFSLPAMAGLMRAADCYVSPYRAEGFNMPVLEALACGVPVLCTAGGPTDEFTDPALTPRIRSVPGVRRLSNKETGDALEPDVEHLVELMRGAVREREAVRQAGLRAALQVAKEFTWEAVTDRLLERLLP